MKYKKVGLVLGGGGAKGAYQIGVYKALYEHGLVKDIALFCGTSIGAINSVLFTLDDIGKIEEVWISLSKDKVLTKKKLKQYFDIRNLKNISIYTRNGFLNLLDSYIRLEDISNNARELYAVATPIRNQFAQTVFRLNGESSEMIRDILLASSAIPGIFESVKIKGIYYMDGYMVSNVPTHIAVTKGCDLVFVVPLGRKDNPNEYSFPNATIVNFKHPSFDDLGFVSGTLGFDPKLIQERIDLGYQSANALLNYLRSIGVITVTRKEKVTHFVKRLFRRKQYMGRKRYYSLEDIGIYRISESKQVQEPSEEEIYGKND